MIAPQMFHCQAIIKFRSYVLFIQLPLGQKPSAAVLTGHFSIPYKAQSG